MHTNLSHTNDVVKMNIILQTKFTIMNTIMFPSVNNLSFDPHPPTFAYQLYHVIDNIIMILSEYHMQMNAREQ